MADVRLFQTNDHVEIDNTELSHSFDTSVYLSLFGGNLDDNGLSSDKNSWWANSLEINPSFQYRSTTQNLLNNLAPTSSNLKRIEDAAKADLRWLIDENAADEVSVDAFLIERNLVKLSIQVTATGDISTYEFTENWINGSQKSNN